MIWGGVRQHVAVASAAVLLNRIFEQIRSSVAAFKPRQNGTQFLVDGGSRAEEFVFEREQK
jgi:hypothetical protein